MNKLIFANLLHRPVRSIISVLAVAIEVVMILSIVGIFMGQLNDQKDRVNGIGADLVVTPPNASFLAGMSGSPLPVALGPFLAKLPHVAVAAPVITKFEMSGGLSILYGIDYESYNALKPFRFIAGGGFSGPYDVIVDDVFARKGNHVGDTIKLLNDHPFKICGIVEAGRGGRTLIPISTMGDLIGSPGRASVIYIKTDDPANIPTIIHEIQTTKGMTDYGVQTMEDMLSQYTPARFPGFSIALNVVIWIAVIVGFLVIFQSMYTAVLERTREIGILKSMGASKLAIVQVVLGETGLVTIAGVALGMAGTAGVHVLLLKLYPTFPFVLPTIWLGKGSLIAFSGSLFGALYPAWLAARKDPIDALAYE
jgi:putative ABC transport system permease protein